MHNDEYKVSNREPSPHPASLPTFPPMRNNSMRSWNWPWISPQIVTGHLTGCNPTVILAGCLNLRGIYGVRGCGPTWTLFSSTRTSRAFSQRAFTCQQPAGPGVSNAIFPRYLHGGDRLPLPLTAVCTRSIAVSGHPDCRSDWPPLEPTPLQCLTRLGWCDRK